MAPDIKGDVMTDQPAIRLTGLTKEFGNVTAVDHVDLEIAAGEFFSMLGPSGSGKTTVLRLIAGFEQPTSGTIELFGQDVTKKAPFDRDVNTVFQDYALFPHMNVLDNVAYGLRVRGMNRTARRDRAMKALASVRLEQFADRKPAQLSGALPSRAPRWCSPRRCCSTSHSARSTSNSASRCRWSSSRSSASSASPSSS
jgi:putative spermidine/putrescine transport system ATP-binding protein